MKIVVVTLTYNEEIILPHFLRHYEKFADTIIVSDSGSTDGTLAILATHPKVKMFPRQPTFGKINDVENVRIKNTAWRTENADWVIVVDCDEFLFCPDMIALLKYCDWMGYNCIGSEAFEMIGTAIPVPHIPITDQISTGFKDETTTSAYNKTLIFKPVTDMIYSPGCHSCYGTGRRTADRGVALLHYKWLSRDYVDIKAKSCEMSDGNHAHKHGYAEDGTQSRTKWVGRYDAGLKSCWPMEFLKPVDKIEVNFIITCFNREEWMQMCLKVIQGYKRIKANVVVVYNGDRPDFDCDLKMVNTGHQTGDMQMTMAGYHWFGGNGCNRFIKIGADTCLCNEEKIISIFRAMEFYQCGYAGNRWGHEQEPALATDVIFADLRFGNVFRNFRPTKNSFEWWMFDHCERKKIKVHYISERIPVHPGNRWECKKLGWTMEHDLAKNKENVKSFSLQKPKQSIR